MLTEYKIIETQCYPKAFKIHAIGYKNDNLNFFETEEKAKCAINKLGGEYSHTEQSN